MVSACSNNIPDLPPDQNPVKVASKAPPAVSGGTLHVTQQGIAIAADSDRDVVWLVDLNTKAIRKVALKAGDEPGRVAEDGAGHAFVALRGSGAVAMIDLAKGEVQKRTNICTAPRGVAYDTQLKQVHVACATGELVSLDSSSNAVVRTLRLDRDLRDVIVRGDNLLLTRFRSAEVVVVDAEGTVLNRQTPPAMGSKGGFDDSFGTSFTPTVAWRAIGLPSGAVALAHQRSADGTVVISQPDGYGGGGDPCGDGTIVNTTISTVDADGNVINSSLPSATIHGATVAVDVATDGNGAFAVASAGTDSIFFTTATQLEQGPFGCGGEGEGEADPGGQPVAVSFWNSQWVAQTREPAALALIQNGQVTRIELPGESVADTGHVLFHHAASGSTALACASCHPEGGEDNHTWFFDTIGARRTQTVAGGVLDTAPLHWDGDMDDLGTIMHEVFENRMGGSPQGPRHISAFADWIQTIPAQRFSVLGPAEQIERGKQLFFRTDVGCADCHNGGHFTNNRNADVGTGRSVQVPTLTGVATRAPFMHDGCAATLHDRFDPNQAACNGGDKHGVTSHLSTAEVNDLIAYLETL